MAWTAIGAGAVKAAPAIMSIFGGRGDGDMSEDERARLAAGARASVYDVAEAMRSGSYLGWPVSSWMGLPRGSTKSRQLLRVTAVAVGAVDAGYRQRGDSGSRQAQDAAISWAQRVDQEHGTQVAQYARSEDPAGFIQQLQRIYPKSSGDIQAPAGGVVGTPAPAVTGPAPGAADPTVTGGISVQLGKPVGADPLGIPLWLWLALPVAIWAIMRMGGGR